MEICSEHGDEIAFAGRDCPACDHVETVTDDLREQLSSEVADLELQISDLEEQLEKKE